MDGSPPGSPVPGILQARTLEWVAISFSNAWKWSHSVVFDSQWPHGLQPTRLLHPWDFPGKSTGVVQSPLSPISASVSHFWSSLIRFLYHQCNDLSSAFILTNLFLVTDVISLSFLEPPVPEFLHHFPLLLLTGNLLLQTHGGSLKSHALSYLFTSAHSLPFAQNFQSLILCLVNSYIS